MTNDQASAEYLVQNNQDFLGRRAELPFGMHNRDEAVNYFAWQVSLFRKCARGKILDHGAGTGSLTSALLAAKVGTELVALEPDPQLSQVLRARFDKVPNVSVYAGTLDDYLGAYGPSSVDTIVSSNVIEHIKDDAACLQSMFRLLRAGGTVGIYVPARPELFGSLDRAVGHHRRYTKPELAAKLTRSGFGVDRIEYRNLIGVLPWLVTGRILKHERVGDGSLKVFDRFVFPMSRRIEDILPPLYGLNLIALGTKP